ncbi:hypothetical protein ES708_16510 [subsurface metagenome]
MKNIKKIDQIVELIKENDTVKIILFGSYAYGKPDNESDIDIFVIKDIEKEKIRDFKITLKRKIRKELNIFGLDILVDSEERIQERIAIGDLFYKEILEKGKVLYTK